MVSEIVCDVLWGFACLAELSVFLLWAVLTADAHKSAWLLLHGVE